jgi:hypothetical protein
VTKIRDEKIRCGITGEEMGRIGGEKIRRRSLEMRRLGGGG